MLDKGNGYKEKLIKWRGDKKYGKGNEIEIRG